MQVPTHVDITIRVELWKAHVLRQVITLLPMTRLKLVQVIRQALIDNPMLEEVPRAEDECTPTGEENAQRLTEADDMTNGQELYDSIWQECVPDDWASKAFPAQEFEETGARFTSEPAEAIVPDVIVMKSENEYQVVLNDEGIPRLRISNTYRRMLREGHLGQPEAKHDLEDKLRSAVWLIRSLRSDARRYIKSPIVW